MDSFPLPAGLENLAQDTRVTIRRGGAPKRNGRCVLYWMQRSQRGRDNHAVDIAVQAANALGLPLVVYFAAIANFPSANLRHYAFLNQGLPDIEEDLAERNITFIMRRYPRESHEQMIADVDPALLIGDENPMRGPESWRQKMAASVTMPFWTVDADVVVPSKLIEKAQYGAYTIRPRLYRVLPDYLHAYANPKAQHALETASKVHRGRCAQGHHRRMDGAGSQRASGGGVAGWSPRSDEAAQKIYAEHAGNLRGTAQPS